VKLGEYAAHMREAGVRRVVFASSYTEVGDYIPPLLEIELEPAHPDTMPAPPIDMSDVGPAEEKTPGQCSVGGCQERAGFHFAPHMCERHGLSQLGVKT
jgi:nucleoside-diphosphate-sugar epimerase